MFFSQSIKGVALIKSSLYCNYRSYFAESFGKNLYKKTIEYMANKSPVRELQPHFQSLTWIKLIRVIKIRTLKKTSIQVYLTKFLGWLK